MSLRTLRAANIAFVVAMLLHGADHARQGYDSLSSEVMWGGVGLAVLAFSSLALTLTNRPHAALYAGIVGLYTAVAVIASHIAPHWSSFSDSYTNDISVDALSWAAMLGEVITGFILGYVGLTLARRRSRAVADPAGLARPASGRRRAAARPPCRPPRPPRPART